MIFNKQRSGNTKLELTFAAIGELRSMHSNSCSHHGARGVLALEDAHSARPLGQCQCGSRRSPAWRRRQTSPAA